MKRKLFAGSTSVSLPIFVQDSSSTTGGGLSGLTSSTPSLVAEYRRQGQSSWTTITLAAKTLGTYTSGGIVADGALSGAYEFDPPDAALASGARFVAIRLRGATNMLPVLIEIELDAVNYQDTVRFGLTALPNAVASASGGLPTIGTGTGQIQLSSGNVVLQDASLTTAKLGTFVLAKTTNITGFNDIAATAVVSGGAITTSGGAVSTVSTVNALAANSVNASALATDAVAEVVAGVWNEVLTGGTYNINNSAGKRLRELAGSVVTSGTAQAGGTASITLAAAASSVDGTYDPSIVRITNGTGAGQSRMIIQYVGSTRVASVDRDWRVAPNATSEYEIISSPNLISTNEGLAQGGTATSITLNSSASSTDDVYVGQTVVLRTGTGQDQARIVASYNGTTKVATVTTPWEVTPASGTGYIMWPLGRSRVASMEDNTLTALAIDTTAIAEIADGVWDEPIAGHLTAGSTGAALNAAGSSGDPWATPLPGAYGAGTAGFIVGTNLDATVSSRATTASIVTGGPITVNFSGGVVSDLLYIDGASDGVLGLAAIGEDRTGGGVLNMHILGRVLGRETGNIDPGVIGGVGVWANNSANATISTAADVTAIKAKTDDITFTNANKVDASILAEADFATVVANKVADILLRRTMANVEASSNGDTLALGSVYGFVQQAQESNTTASAGNLTVYRTDGSTVLGTKALATNASAEPITGIS